MKNFKEFAQISESQGPSRETTDPRVFDVEIINQNICNLIHRQAKEIEKFLRQNLEKMI
jgi:hypothetical protein